MMPILSMVNCSNTQCPRFENERRAVWQEEYDALKKTAVADHPMLAAAWDDPADPRSVPIAGGWELRRGRVKWSV